MWNAGRTPARMIEVISPAGFEGFFREVAELIPSGPPTLDAMAALATSYGLEFSDAEWLPDIIARYGLNPPPMPRGLCLLLARRRRARCSGRWGGARPRRAPESPHLSRLGQGRVAGRLATGFG